MDMEKSGNLLSRKPSTFLLIFSLLLECWVPLRVFFSSSSFAHFVLLQPQAHSQSQSRFYSRFNLYKPSLAPFYVTQVGELKWAKILWFPFIYRPQIMHFNAPNKALTYSNTVGKFCLFSISILWSDRTFTIVIKSPLMTYFCMYCSVVPSVQFVTHCPHCLLSLY